MLNSIARQASLLICLFTDICLSFHCGMKWAISTSCQAQAAITFMHGQAHTAKQNETSLQWSQAQAVEYLHKLKVVLLATKHLTVPINHQPSIHQLMVRWVVQRLHLKHKQQQHTHVAVFMATHWEPQHNGERGEGRGVGGKGLWRGRGGRDEGLDLRSLGLKASLKNTHAAALSVRAQEGIWQFASKKKRGSWWRMRSCIWKDLLWRIKRRRRRGRGGCMWPSLHLCCCLETGLLAEQVGHSDGSHNVQVTSRWLRWWCCCNSPQAHFKRYPLMDSIQETK